MADILNKLNSANYVTVKVTDNAITNGNNLLAAYANAKTKTPNGAALSASNRLAVILPPAIYDLGTQSLTLDTQYIDIIGSTTDREKHHIKSNVGVISTGTVMQTANDVKLYNLKIENTNTTYSKILDDTDAAAYFPDSNLNLTYIENVKFLSNDSYIWTMRISIEYSGTFINCTGGRLSFGGGYAIGGTISGTFKDCTGGNYSFAGTAGFGNGTISSTAVLENCTGGELSFGGCIFSSTVDGIFLNCTGGTGSFGGNYGSTIGSTAVFKNCTGGDLSFGSNGTAGGTFENCSGGVSSFGGSGGTASGTFIDCNGGDGSFNL